jgi:hypothetical protein
MPHQCSLSKSHQDFSCHSSHDSPERASYGELAPSTCKLIGCPPGSGESMPETMPLGRAGVDLLRMPRRPAVRQVYEMPPAYYDVTDVVGHPVLVISVDPVTRTALIVTRTSKNHAKGKNAIVHQAQPELGLDVVGWWRMAFPKQVPYSVFDQPDVKRRGELDAATWVIVLSQMKGTNE